MEYAENVKARMVRRMLGPDAVSATSLAGETGISQATLSRWLAASIKGVSTSKLAAPTITETATTAKWPQDWTALERAPVVV